MKRAILFAALLATLSPLALHTAEASSATINLALASRCISAIAIVAATTGTAVAGVNRAGGTIAISTTIIAGGVTKSGNAIEPGSVNVSAAGTSANVANTGVTITDTTATTATTIITVKKSRRRRSRDFFIQSFAYQPSASPTSR